MYFDWTAEELALKQSVAALLTQDAATELGLLDEAELWQLKRITSRYLKALSGLGYLEIALGPAERGQLMRLIAGQEELAKASGSLFLATETTARIFGGLLAGFGDRSRIGDILEAVTHGEVIAGVAVTESEEDAAEPGLTTAGVRDGKEWVVSGRKDYVTNAPIADWIAVVGIAEGRPAAFLVEPPQAGATVGPRMRTLGFNGLAVARLELDSVRVPNDLVIGPFADEAALEYLGAMQDLILALAAVGLQFRTTAEAKRHALTHRRDGKDVFRYQEVRFKLAEMLTWAQTSQLLTFRAAWLYATGDPEARTVIHCAKVFCAEGAEQVTSMGMQVLAGRGYLSGNPVEQAYRDAKLTGIAGTTSERARMAIAGDLLKRYQV
ncbi:MAG: acyl-CoA dehydrogenase [Desulfomonile sp.]|nr:acyl-CoA dehydrogenase [Desulfomonile sp.]